MLNQIIVSYSIQKGAVEGRKLCFHNRMLLAWVRGLQNPAKKWPTALKRISKTIAHTVASAELDQVSAKHPNPAKTQILDTTKPAHLRNKAHEMSFQTLCRGGELHRVREALRRGKRKTMDISESTLTSNGLQELLCNAQFGFQCFGRDLLKRFLTDCALGTQTFTSWLFAMD